MYFVSRQAYWPDGNSVVEVCTGGKDYCNPDMLIHRFPELGEGQEFADPMEAVEAAIKICDAWNKLMGLEEEARVEVGNTSGYTMPFEEYPTDEQLRDWAKKELESLPKCYLCNDIIDEKYKYHLSDDAAGEYDFCSERCAETFYNNFLNSEIPEEDGGELLP